MRSVAEGKATMIACPRTQTSIRFENPAGVSKGVRCSISGTAKGEFVTSVAGQSPATHPARTPEGTPGGSSAVSWEDRATRRARIVRSLAQYLASETAKELAGLSAPPVIEIAHDYEGIPVLEGSVIEARVIVHDFERGHIRATVMVPGEAVSRPFVPDRPVTFPATKTGPILVSAKNVLNPRTVTAASPSIHVAEIPRVNPFTFTGVDVTGLTDAHVADLAQAMTAARADGLELDPWVASEQILALSAGDRAAAAAEFDSMEKLLAAMSTQVSEGLTLQLDLDVAAGRSMTVSAASLAPSLIGLRSQVGAQLLLDARAQLALALAARSSGMNGDTGPAPGDGHD